jgi:cold-inducible RNA-binding protein
MSNRLFVGNLPFHATEDLLKQTFSASGDVSSVSLVLDRETGQSRGFGFVEMATPEAAKKAINDLNGTDLGGRPLRVDVAGERKPRDGGGGGGFGGGGGGGRRNDRRGGRR